VGWGGGVGEVGGSGRGRERRERRGSVRSRSLEQARGCASPGAATDSKQRSGQAVFDTTPRSAGTHDQALLPGAWRVHDLDLDALDAPLKLRQDL